MSSQTENVLSLVSAIFSWVDRTKVDLEFSKHFKTITVEVQVECKLGTFRVVGFKGDTYSPFVKTSIFWSKIPQEELPIAKAVVDLVMRYINNK